jgi:CheY-like chemotaxis protein
MENQVDQRAIIVVEDSDVDYKTILWIFKKLDVTYPVIRCEDGDAVLEYLYEQSNYTGRNKLLRPALILLDLNLPGVDGRSILRQIKTDERFKILPVVVLTTTSNSKDIKTCYQNGASTYIIKPVNLENFVRSIKQMLAYWFEAATLPEAFEL